MDVNEIRSFIQANQANEEVKALLSELQPALSIDVVKDFVTKDEAGIKWLQKETDTKVTKGITTWKEKNLQKEVDTQIKALYPEESEQDKTLRQLQADLAAEKRARVQQQLKNKALSEATAKGLPTSLVDYFLGEDEESTMTNLATLENVFQQSIQSVVEGKFKQNGYVPAGSAPASVYTREQLASMSPEDINKNWDAISKAMADGTLN